MTQTTAAGSSPVVALSDRFWQATLEQQPIIATLYGDDRWDDKLSDPGPEGRAAARALCEQTLREAMAIPQEGLSVEDDITRDMLRVACELRLAELDQRWEILESVDQMSGVQTLLPDIATFQQADTPERLEKLLARIAAYPDFVAKVSDLVREGAANGMTQPSIIVERTIAQIERLLSVPADQNPAVEVAKVASPADRQRVADAIARYARPAEQAYLELLKSTYLPAARKEAGLSSVPNGEALYRSRILYWTTLELEPADVHAIGLDEMTKLEAERRAIANAAGFGDDTAAYRAAMWADPSDVPGTKEDLVARAYEDIDRAMAAAPRFFGRLPRAGCEVRPVEPFKEADSPFAYYYPPTADGKRPGVYYVNTYDLPSRHFSALASTTYHEAAPGHHFQIALEMELPELPDFRRLGSRMVGAAFAEGWGLYSERLADAMGLYRNDYERFAMLDGQAWRAGRLVVDTGMHALGWTRQQSIDYLVNVAGLTQTNAVIETDRYIMWPGQALAYMTGRREIDRLRAEAERALGSRFDLKRFHDETIGHGSLPLATLSRELPRWLGISTGG